MMVERGESGECKSFFVDFVWHQDTQQQWFLEDTESFGKYSVDNLLLIRKVIGF